MSEPGTKGREGLTWEVSLKGIWALEFKKYLV